MKMMKIKLKFESDANVHKISKGAKILKPSDFLSVIKNGASAEEIRNIPNMNEVFCFCFGCDRDNSSMTSLSMSH